MIYEYKGGKYPDYLKCGNAMQFIAAAALQFCRGRGLDIGAGKWPLPGALPIDLAHGGDAYKLPPERFDYIFSSHCLEHLAHPVAAIEHWKSRLKPGGVLFLYLPHPDMEYWLPQNNKKHLHLFRPSDVARMLRDLGFINVIWSERDLAWSFSVVGFLPGQSKASDACAQFANMLDDGKAYFRDDPQMLAILEHFGSDIFRRSSLFDGLNESLRAWKIRGKRAVEIGTFNGITALVLARYFDEVISIDVLPWTAKHAVKDFAKVHNVKFIDVANNDEKSAALLGLDFDFAYQDGNHETDTQSDFALLRKGGRVLFHEYWEQSKPVWDLVNKLRGDKDGTVDVRGKLALWKAAGK